MMACLYATYCPLYFSNLLCPSNTKKAEINSYAKRDYLTTFQSFRKYLKNKEFSDEEIDKISNLCNEEWKLLKQNEAKYEIMLVKRSYFEKDKLQDIYEILCDKETDIAVLASQIMDTKIDNFTWSKDIPSNVIGFVEIPYADYIIEKEDTEVEVILPTVRTVSSPEDGKVSVLLLLGTIFILLGVMLYVGIVLYENLFISYFALIFLFNNYNRVNKFVNRLQQFIRRCTMVDNNKKRINQVFKNDLMPIEKFGDKNLPNFQGKIEFKDITFSYDDINLNKKLKDDLKTKKELKKELKKNKSQNEQEQNPPKKVLENFSLKINAGERVAFVGKSGCGKSTLVSLLSKSLSAQSGTVLFDGVDINQLSESAIRDNVTVINQFPYIYFMSLRDNIKIVKPDASDEEILKACEKAYLKNFINELPFGLDTILGENGVKVSGGQKQRIAIARAFLKDTKVMVFDESTSSLDNFAQKYVQTSIDEIKNKTVIIVAHRLSTIINCDKIVFIDEGKVKAVGTFNELMANCSEFAKLYTLRR